MTEPLRLTFQSVEVIPSDQEIADLVTDDRHIVLVFPATSSTDIDKRNIIDRLAHELPEYSVFDSGGAEGTISITVMKVVPTAVVETHAAEIIAAAHLFHEKATDLMIRLARKLGAPPDSFTADPLFGRQYPQFGRLGANWRYGFHGFECGFSHYATGQRIEVRLGFATGFGVLDPYFFGEFIKSTPGMENLGRLFKDSFHDTRRALEILERRGDVKSIQDTKSWQSGWVLFTYGLRQSISPPHIQIPT